MLRAREFFVGLILIASPVVSMADTVTDLLNQYRNQGAKEFSGNRGEHLWTQAFIDRKTGKERRCTTCHTGNLKDSGKHVRTGKEIRPMAPSVNPKRLTNSRKIEKWFKRNCKWTLGRECDPQEKGDILSFLSQQ